MKDNSDKKIDFFVESRLLKALYNNAKLFEDDLVDESLMLTTSSKNLFLSMKKLYEKGVPFTRDAIYQEYLLNDLNANSAVVDGIAIKDDEIVTDVRDIVDQLHDAKKRIGILNGIEQLKHAIDKVPRLDEKAVDEIRENIFKVDEALSTENNKHEFLSMKEWADQHNQEFLKRRDGKVYAFHNFLLDPLVPDGAQPGEYGIITSQSGSGKSATILNVFNSCIENYVPAILYNLEMSGETTMDRLCALRLGIPYEKIKNPSEEEFDEIRIQLEEEKARLSQLDYIYVSSSPTLNIPQLEMDVKRFKAKSGVTHCIAFIDLLSMMEEMTTSESGANFAQSIEIGVNKLSAACKRGRFHVLGTLQSNRESESAKVHDLNDIKNLKPTRTQIKNANAFLERARYVITTFRPKMFAEMYLEPEEHEDLLDEIWVSVVKVNDGSVGVTVKGLFEPKYFRIEPIDIPEADCLDDAFAESN